MRYLSDLLHHQPMEDVACLTALGTLRKVRRVKVGTISTLFAITLLCTAVLNRRSSFGHWEPSDFRTLQENEACN